MRKWIESSSTEIFKSGDPATVFEYNGSGLGYYINPDPNPEGDHWYKPIHISSKSSVFDIMFFHEHQCRQFVREVAPLLDWHLDADALMQHEGYPAMCKQAQEIQERILGVIFGNAL
jgi:hypothetical protein